jgi:hypothetical protein
VVTSEQIAKRPMRLPLLYWPSRVVLEILWWIVGV